jgi:hypothetical protein
MNEIAYPLVVQVMQIPEALSRADCNTDKIEAHRIEQPKLLRDLHGKPVPVETDIEKVKAVNVTSEMRVER